MLVTAFSLHISSWTFNVLSPFCFLWCIYSSSECPFSLDTVSVDFAHRTATQCLSCLYIYLFPPFPFCNTLVIRICIRFVWEIGFVWLNDLAFESGKIHPLILGKIECAKQESPNQSILVRQGFCWTWRRLTVIVEIVAFVQLVTSCHLSNRNDKIMTHPGHRCNI